MLVVVKDEVVRLGVMGVADEMLVVESRQVFGNVFAAPAQALRCVSIR
jgi:hypothetical protein